MVAVPGPNGMRNAVISANDSKTTSTTGTVVITPSIGRRAVTQKLTVSRINAAASVSSSDDT